MSRASNSYQFSNLAIDEVGQRLLVAQAQVAITVDELRRADEEIKRLESLKELLTGRIQRERQLLSDITETYGERILKQKSEAV